MADGPALTELVRASGAYGGKYGVMVETQIIDAAYVAANPVGVAEEAGQLAGFYSVLIPERGAEGEGELDFMFVADDSQGHGLGRALMEDLRREASARGLRRIHIAAHPPADGFYRACGARPSGHVPPRGRITWPCPVLVLWISAISAP